MVSLDLEWDMPSVDLETVSTAGIPTVVTVTLEIVTEGFLRNGTVLDPSVYELVISGLLHGGGMTLFMR